MNYNNLDNNEIEKIEWDYLENCWIDNLGNSYKSVVDVPEDLKYSCIDNPSLLKYYDIPENLYNFVEFPKKIGKLKVRVKHQKGNYTT